MFYGLLELIVLDLNPRFDKLFAVTSFLWGLPDGPDDEAAGAGSAAMTFHFSLTLLNAALWATFASLTDCCLLGALPSAMSSC